MLEITSRLLASDSLTENAGDMKLSKSILFNCHQKNKKVNRDLNESIFQTMTIAMINLNLYDIVLLY